LSDPAANTPDVGIASPSPATAAALLNSLRDTEPRSFAVMMTSVYRSATARMREPIMAPVDTAADTAQRRLSGCASVPLPSAGGRSEGASGARATVQAGDSTVDLLREDGPASRSRQAGRSSPFLLGARISSSRSPEVTVTIIYTKEM
jgi:hypothetical protein